MKAEENLADSKKKDTEEGSEDKLMTDESNGSFIHG